MARQKYTMVPFFRPLSSSNFTRQDSMVDEMLHGSSPNRHFQHQSFRTSMRAHQIACVTYLAVQSVNSLELLNFVDVWYAKPGLG